MTTEDVIKKHNLAALIRAAERTGDKKAADHLKKRWFESFKEPFVDGAALQKLEADHGYHR